MPGIHTEGAFEQVIENYLLAGGYIRGFKADYDQSLALDPVQLFSFIETAQPEEWEKYQRIATGDPNADFLKRLTAELASRGSLDVWRRGFKDRGCDFRLVYFKPSTGAGPELLERYELNRLSVVRQLKYDATRGNTLDLAIFLNGIPLATAELKNHASGQSVDDAIKQYRTDRHPADQMFRYTERALVHFAVDDAAVYMTTRLQGSDTSFLPFNKGDHGSAGNPDNPNGYKTSYLWEEAWQRDSLLDIVQRFIGIEYPDDVGAKKQPKKGQVIFPRYHQLDVVRKLEEDARVSGPGNDYLIMHSTGSGKSLSIAWTAHRLYSLHDGNDERIFHSVVVVTDRVVLNRQLQDTIYSIDHKFGVVERIERGSTQLAEALEKGSPIIITTLQTFPFVVEKIAELPDRNYAVIADEAHSSQTGISAAKLKAVLGGWEFPVEGGEEADGAEGSVDVEEALVAAAQARGKQDNLSYFAFTATPKAKTLEIFGVEGDDGKFRPFHVYSMKQAIEEAFILDVLANYTTYDRYFKLTKAIEDDPQFEKRSAAKAIAKFVELHPHNLAQKAATVVDHFDTAVAPKIGGKAKAMVVTGSRIHAVKTYFALKKEVEGQDYLADPGILVAFSGTVTDPDTGVSYTETELNGFGETELPKRFNGPGYRILVVAEKYQTGFDQPLLHTMYVDKKLAGVHAVQTLSRLNRRAPGKEDTFVLDFVNEADQILEAYSPYYETAVLSRGTDPNLLYHLEGALRDFGVFYPQELDAFVEVLLKDPNDYEPGDPGKLNAIVDAAVGRFKTEHDEEGQDTFRRVLGQFVRLYAFLSNVIEWQDAELEKLFQYGRWLLRKLPEGAGTPVLELDDDVALAAYRLEKDHEGPIVLGEPTELNPPSALGGRLTPEQYVRLSELIEAINEKFGLNLTEADMLFIEQVGQDIMADDDLAVKAKANTRDVFKGEFDKEFLGKVLKRKDRNAEMLKMILDNPEFADLIKAQMLPWVYDGLKKRRSTPDLMADGESDTVEFKSTARWNVKAGQKDLRIEDAAVKSVAAFLNSGGGTLLIGVDDEGRAGPLEHDLQLFNGSIDKWENWLVSSLLTNALGKNAVAHVNVSIAEIDGSHVARLDVQQAPGPVWAKTSKDEGVFYVRLVNATHELQGAEELQYIQEHWKDVA